MRVIEKHPHLNRKMDRDQPHRMLKDVYRLIKWHKATIMMMKSSLSRIKVNLYMHPYCLSIHKYSFHDLQTMFQLLLLRKAISWIIIGFFGLISPAFLSCKVFHLLFFYFLLFTFVSLYVYFCI